AHVASVRAEGAVQELSYMRMQGQIVETVGDMSAQHKAECARLEADLAAARADYRKLQEMAVANRAAFEARVAELDARIAESGAAPDAAQLESENAALAAQVQQLGDLATDLEARLEVADYAVDDERAEADRQRLGLESQNAHMTRVLEQCEVDMAAHVEQISAMGQHIAELESDRAIMAEQTQFQIAWLKENYAKAYQDLDAALNGNGGGGGGHNNLRQRIRYVESLKTQILALKRECLEAARDRDRFRHSAALLKSELGAYKEVSGAEALRSRVPARARSVARRPDAASAADGPRSALARKGAAVARRALDDARQHQQMAVVDE
ncbi:hypothetical protein IWQ56_007418, partial [Coemansia nantahalensis]